MKKNFSLWWVSIVTWIIAGIIGIVRCANGMAINWTTYWVVYAAMILCMLFIAISETFRRWW